MPTQITNLRIAGDPSRFDHPQDNLLKRTPRFRRGSDLDLSVGVYSQGAFTGIENIATITLQLIEIADPGDLPRPGTNVLVSQTLGASSLNPAVSESEWSNGQGEHARFSLTHPETSFVAGLYWLSIVAHTADSPARRSVLAAGPIECLETGYTESPAPDPVEDTYYTAAVADSRFLLAANIRDDALLAGNDPHNPPSEASVATHLSRFYAPSRWVTLRDLNRKPHLRSTGGSIRVELGSRNLSSLPFTLSVTFLCPTQAAEYGLWAFTGSLGTSGTSVHGLTAFISSQGDLILRKFGAFTSDWRQLTCAGFLSEYQEHAVRMTWVFSGAEVPRLYLNGNDVSSSLVQSQAGTAPSWSDKIAEGRLILGRGPTAGNDFEGKLWPAETFLAAGELSAAEAAAVETLGWPARLEFVTDLANDVANPDFETNTSGWTGFQATLSRNTIAPISGTGDLRVDIDNGENNAQVYATVFDNAAAQETGVRVYRLSFDYATDAGVNVDAWQGTVGPGVRIVPLGGVSGTGSFDGLFVVDTSVTLPERLTIRVSMDTGTSGGSDGANIDNVRVQPLGKLFDWSGGASRSPLIVDQSGNGIDGLAEGRIQKIGGHWPRELRGKRSTAGYLIADEKVLPGGHLIKAIYAYSEAGGNLTVGDGPSTDAANIVASATLAAATWTDLDLLKHSSSTRKLHMTPTATTKLVVELIETPEFP